MGLCKKRRMDAGKEEMVQEVVKNNRNTQTQQGKKHWAQKHSDNVIEKLKNDRVDLTTMAESSGVQQQKVQMLQGTNDALEVAAREALENAGLISPRKTLADNSGDDNMLNQTEQKEKEISPAIVEASSQDQMVHEVVTNSSLLPEQGKIDVGNSLIVMPTESTSSLIVVQNQTPKDNNQTPKDNTTITDVAHELQEAFQKLQGMKLALEPPDNMERGMIVLNEQGAISDGTGTRTQTNMGIKFVPSAPNSDGEQESDIGEGDGKKTTRKKKGPTRKSSRNTKDKYLIPPSN